MEIAAREGPLKGLGGFFIALLEAHELAFESGKLGEVVGIKRTFPNRCFVPTTDSRTAARQHLYSITSSASASNVGGILRPSAFAVLRLMINSNLVGSITGRSAGFSPLRIRPV